MRRLTCWAAVVMGLTATEARAQWGHPVGPDPSLYPVAPHRPSAYDHWAYYGISSRGQYRPLVNFGAGGAYFLYNGAPFPSAYLHNTEIVPFAPQTIYRSPAPALPPPSFVFPPAVAMPAVPLLPAPQMTTPRMPYAAD